jgi:hypothetical protein
MHYRRGKRQQERKLKTLETRVEQALWFSESFGLKVDTVKLVDHLGNPYSLSFGEKGRKSYKHLPTKEQQKNSGDMTWKILHQ